MVGSGLKCCLRMALSMCAHACVRLYVLGAGVGVSYCLQRCVCQWLALGDGE